MVPKIDGLDELTYNLGLGKLVHIYERYFETEENDPTIRKVARTTLEALGQRGTSDIEALVKTYLDNSDFEESLLPLHEDICRTLKALGNRNVNEAVSLIKTYHNKSDYNEYVSSLCNAVCLTFKALGDQDVSNAEILINAYFEASGYNESAFTVNSCVYDTLKELKGRNAVDAKVLIKSYGKYSNDEPSSLLAISVCKTLNALSWRSVSDAEFLIKAYYDASEGNEPSSMLSESVCNTFNALEGSVYNAEVLIRSYSKFSKSEEPSFMLSRSVCSTLKACKFNGQDISEAAKLIKKVYEDSEDELNSLDLSIQICEKLEEGHKIKEEIFVKSLEELKSISCFYKSDTKKFTECFSNANKTDKKRMLRAIFNCNFENKEAINWLDTNHSKLVREIGLEPDKKL